MIYIASIMTSFVFVFLKGFQIKNVQGRHMKTLAATSLAIGACEVFTIGFVIHGGMWIAVTAALGGTLGMVCSVLMHEKIFGRKK